jgi:molecular chaperone GrpE
MNNDDNTQQNTELERVKELENNWKRALADYKNLEKRVAEEKQDGLAFSNMILISQLIPVLDNLEMLEKHIDDKGMKLVVKDFKQILQNEGLEEIDTQGKEFDPFNMDAVEMIEGKPNKVIEVLQKGYKLKDKLIRPAKVKVGKGEQPKEEK